MQQATILNVDRAGRRFALMGFARGAARVGFLIAMIAASAAAVGALFAADQSRAMLTQATVGYLLLAGSFFVVAAALAWDDGSWPVVTLWLPHFGLSILMLAKIAVFAFALFILAVVLLWRRIQRTAAIPLVSERFWISHALGASPGLAKIRIRKRSIPFLFFLGTLSLSLSIAGVYFFPESFERLIPLQSEIAQAAIWFGIWTAPFLGGVAFLELAERHAVTSARVLASVDSRPPVLFLRSFQDDRLLVLATWFEAFTWLMTGLRFSAWNDFARLMAEQKAGVKYRPRDVANEIFRRRALEDILLLEFSNYGPIIAIGDPRHKTQYFGAARDFYEGEDWRQAVVENMRKSRAIIVALDETEGVRWEMETLAREGLLEKTLFRNCFATAQKFSYNRYYVTLRWFFRSRWGEMEAL